MQGDANSMRGSISGARHGAVSSSQTNHQIAIVEWISECSSRFIGHHSFGAAELVEKAGHFFKIARATVIDNFNSSEISALALGSLADRCFITEQSYASESNARAH